MKVKNKKLWGIVGVFLISIMSAIAAKNSSANNQTTSELISLNDLTPYPEFIITNDTQFGPSGHNFPGTGIPSDPYIIENYNITSSGPNGILIDASGGFTGFNVSFIIRNCWITAVEVCIKIVDAYPSLVTIDNCVCVNTLGGDGVGIYLIRCDGATIINCQCNFNFHTGIRIDMCAGMWVENNTCYNNADEGIFIDNAANGGLYLENKCEKNAWGIRSDFSQSNTFRYNNCTDNSYTGYAIYYSDWVIAENNTALKNDDFGFQILSSYNGLLMFNHIEETRLYAIYFETNINSYAVHHNNFIGNNAGGTSQALDDDITGTPQVTWYDTTTNEGNYWDDYSGSGNYIIDGTANNFDPYPLSSQIDITVIPEISPNQFLYLLLVFSTIGLISIMFKKK